MQISTETPRVIAGCFALAAFAVATLAGLSGGAPAAQVLLNAVMAMMLCYPVGLVAGMVCDRVIRAHIESERAAQEPLIEPSPSSSPAAAISVSSHDLADPSRDEHRAAA